MVRVIFTFIVFDADLRKHDYLDSTMCRSFVKLYKPFLAPSVCMATIIWVQFWPELCGIMLLALASAVPQSLSGPCSAGLMTRFYCLKYEILPICKAIHFPVFFSPKQDSPVTLRPKASRVVCLSVRHPSRPTTRFLLLLDIYGFLVVGRPP
jgi:hypothetical protein